MNSLQRDAEVVSKVATPRLEVLTRAPDGPPRPTPLLFVHGAWHGAWCWEPHFLPFFAAHGHASTALSLRGHGRSEGRERLRWTRLVAYADDVVEVASALPSPPVLIGHSMGGAAVQIALERFDAPAAVLLASVPPRGVLPTTLRIARRHPLRFLHANLTLSLWPLVSTPALAREHFFSRSMPAAEVSAYAARLQDESYLAFLDMLLLRRPRPSRIRASVLVLGAEGDTIFRPGEVRATARAYRTEAVLFPDMAHDMMLEPGREAVADHILGWLDARKL